MAWTYNGDSFPTFPSYASAPAIEPSAGKTAFVISGQSNATERTNTEATDADVQFAKNEALITANHYFGTRLGKNLKGNLSATDVYIYYYAQVGTKIEQWGRGGLTNILIDNYQATIASGVEPHFGVWYQGEGNTTDNYYEGYEISLAHLLDQWRQLWGNIPVFVVQLKGNTSTTLNGNYLRLQDKQWRFDANSGDALSFANVYVIPAHDLPFGSGETVHLSSSAGLTLADRIYNRWQEEINSSASGYRPPRVTNIGHSSGVVTITFNQTMNSHTDYDNFFSVYDDGSAATISSIARKTGDDTSIEITLSATPSGTITVDGNCSEDSVTSMEIARANVPQNANGMPCFAFGPLGLGAY